MHLIFYFTLYGCINGKKTENELIVIDINISPPEKEIRLEEIADIEYLQLEFHDNFLFANTPHVITEKYIILSSDGDVLIFSREGKPLSKFNHIGQGPGEYFFVSELLFDEQSEEIMIKTVFDFLIYSLSGDFKRKIPLADRMDDFYCQFVDYNAESLLFYNEYDFYPSPFTFISKQDGSVVDSVIIPKGEAIDLFVFSQDRSSIGFTKSYNIVKYRDGFLLADFSLDTIYYLSQERRLSPVLVRTPNVQSMNPVIFLNNFIEAGNYIFFTTVTVKDQLPKTYLMREQKTGSIFRQHITFNDYKGKDITLSAATIANTHDSKLGFIALSLTELQDANRENRLSGRLKELVDNSDKDGNDIYMLLHFK
ncbi:MAG: 6-bladed beta-propeller [Tannerella sp.]|nr:6-bladed beta-propeller [Tannerella sp.]